MMMTLLVTEKGPSRKWPSLARSWACTGTATATAASRVVHRTKFMSFPLVVRWDRTEHRRLRPNIHAHAVTRVLPPRRRLARLRTPGLPLQPSAQPTALHSRPTAVRKVLGMLCQCTVSRQRKIGVGELTALTAGGLA